MVLLVAAAPEELDTLPGRVVGVGPVVAASRAAAIIDHERPDAVCLIGTAGSYAGGPPIGTAVAARKLGLSHGVATMGLGYVPRAPAPIESDERLLSLLDLPRFNVLTAGAVTTDLTLAARLSDGWEVEHLEAYAVALACHERKIPFVAVLGISNFVGPDAHTEWLTNREEAQAAARSACSPLFP